MASDPTIRAALEAAGEAVRLRARFSPATGKELSLDFASAAIAAFLRAHGFRDAANQLHPQHMTPALLARWLAFDAKESRK